MSSSASKSGIQEIFGTEGGDLRQMLRNEIDTCVALVQLAGDCYGAEPPTVDPEVRPRLLHPGSSSATPVGKRGKTRGYPPPQVRTASGTRPPPSSLSTPNTAIPSPTRRSCAPSRTPTVQASAPRAHLCHYPATDNDLKIAILELRNDSDDLRAQQQAIEKTMPTPRAPLPSPLWSSSSESEQDRLPDHTEQRFDEIPKQVNRSPSTDPASASTHHRLRKSPRPRSRRGRCHQGRWGKRRNSGCRQRRPPAAPL